MRTVRILTLMLTSLVCVSADLSIVTGDRPISGESNDVDEHIIPGCWLGSVFYELGKTWHPEVGDESMNCIVCTCEPVIKKGDLKKEGHINCRYLADECPPVDCANPVLLPGECCKTCPGKGLSPFQFPWEILPPTSLNQGGFLSDLVQNKEFLALLIGQGPMTSLDTQAVARGRFTMFHTSLSYSVEVSGSLKPTRLWFTNHQGSILNEHIISTPTDDLICGTWHELPNIYLEYLLDGQLNIMLGSSEHEKGHLSGTLLPHDSIERETFSSVMTPSTPDGSGGVALMTLDKRGKTLSLALIQRGFPLQYDKKMSLKVSFKRGKRLLVEMPVEMNSETGQLTTQWTGLTRDDLKQMTRGKINVGLQGESGAELKGKVTPKRSCNVLQASVSAVSKDNAVGAGAVAFLRVSQRGQINYKISFNNLPKKLRKLTIESPVRRNGRPNTLCRVPKRAIQMVRKDGEFQGTASGVCSKIDAREMNLLLSDHVSVKIETNDGQKGALQGSLSELLYDDTFADVMDKPFILTSTSLAKPVSTTGTGHAWLTLSSRCRLQYQIVVSGLRGLLTAKLVAADGQEWTLEEFNGKMVRGTASKLPVDVSDKLNSGALYLVVANRRHPRGVIGTLLELPSSCNKEEAPTDIFFNDEVDASKEEERKCRYDTKYYEDGTSWPSVESICKTCSCQLGEVTCHNEVCPVPTCDKPVRISGECCPQCIERPSLPNRKTCFFNGDKKQHLFGTTWHPYVPPFGYSKCVLCRCKNEDEVDCRRLACPALRCPAKVAIQRHDDCCKVCPDNYVEETQEGDQSQVQQDSKPGSCKFQGTTYDNGVTWHPRVRPYGEVACVTCACMNGSAKCKRPKCPKLSCKKADVIHPSGFCCPRCKGDTVQNT